MTKKICLIGNSALACVKKAWENASLEVRSQADLTFFASSAYSTEKLFLRGSALSSDDDKVREQFVLTSGGSSDIDILSFDLFVIYGLSFECRDYLRAFKTHALLEDKDCSGSRSLMSEEMHYQLISDLYEMRPGKRLAKAISAVSDAAIVLGSAPLPTEVALRPGQLLASFDPGADREFLVRLGARYRREFLDRAKASGWMAFVQGEDTLTDLGFTKVHFSEDGIGLPQNVTSALERGKHYRHARADDPWHLNESFGTLVLLDILRTVGLR